MSYGVLVSRAVQLQVTALAPPAAAAGETTAALDAFRARWGGAWVPGRLSLTRLHLSFIPSRTTRGTTILELALGDLAGPHLGGGLVHRTITLRAATHRLAVRCLGAPALAEQLGRSLPHR